MIPLKKDVADFFERERNKLMYFIYNKMDNASDMDAEDILQEVILNLFDKADISFHVENLAAYVYRSIHNKIIDYYRKRKRTVSIESIAEDENALMQGLLSDFRYEPENIAEAEDFKVKFITAIDSLDPMQKAVWIATEMEGRSFKDLSLEWNEPIGTLLSRKNRAAKKLQKMLKEYDY